MLMKILFHKSKASFANMRSLKQLICIQYSDSGAGWENDVPGSLLGKEKRGFILSKASKTVLGPIQPSTQ
jgi:hypothetical protein